MCGFVLSVIRDYDTTKATHDIITYNIGMHKQELRLDNINHIEMPYHIM